MMKHHGAQSQGAHLARANEAHAVFTGKAELRPHVNCENHGAAEDVLSPAWVTILE